MLLLLKQKFHRESLKSHTSERTKTFDKPSTRDSETCLSFSPGGQNLNMFGCENSERVWQQSGERHGKVHKEIRNLYEGH